MLQGKSKRGGNDRVSEKWGGTLWSECEGVGHYGASSKGWGIMGGVRRGGVL